MITFGPTKTAEESEALRRLTDLSSRRWSHEETMTSVQPCNCIGPQPGETKCPCMLAAELRQAEMMISDGVVIAGCKYRLVREA